jgi:hypothetical protein
MIELRVELRQQLRKRKLRRVAAHEPVLALRIGMAMQEGLQHRELV